MASLLAILFQDLKDRQVYLWLILLSAVGLAALHIVHVGLLQFAIHSVINISITTLILAVLWGYARFKMRVDGLQAVFGLGDILFLFALAVGFTTVSFITFFVFGLLFSLLLHLVFSYTLSRKRTLKKKETTVPLAGYLALFFAGVLGVHWFGLYDNLYTL
jgi:hypothetical protein